MAGIVARVSPFHLAERRAFIEQLAREHRVSLPGFAIERMAGCEVPLRACPPGRRPVRTVKNCSASTTSTSAASTLNSR